MSIPTQFFSWEMLATLGGAAAGVFLIVQMTKDLLPRWLPVRVYAWVLGWGLLSAAAWATGQLTAVTLGINVLNGGIVAFAAMGEYAIAKDQGVARAQAERTSAGSDAGPGETR
jgi:hypothetical protein